MWITLLIQAREFKGVGVEWVVLSRGRAVVVTRYQSPVVTEHPAGPVRGIGSGVGCLTDCRRRRERENVTLPVLDGTTRAGPGQRAGCGIEHATGPKSSREVSGHGTLGDVATPFPDPQSQRKEAWSRASPDAVPRSRLQVGPPLVDGRNPSSKPTPAPKRAAAACPGARECSSSSSPSSSSHSCLR